MSLILEALRKSEAERRRGEAPGLRMELPPAAAPERRTLPALAWVAGIAFLALLVLAILWLRGGESGAGAPAGTVAGIDEAAITPVAESPTGVPDTVAPTDADAFPRVDRIQPPDETPSAAPDPIAPPGAAAPAPAPAPAPEIVLPLPAPAPAAVAPAASAPPPPRATTAPRIAELAPSQRQRLPAMKLSMHMWNEDPARRFAVVDGQRKMEGDRIGEATITAIDRDGLLLDLDGQAVRVPLP